MSLTKEQASVIAQTQNAFRGPSKISLSTLQQLTTTSEPEVRGASWVSRTTFPASPPGEDTIESLINDAICELSKEGEQAEFLGTRDVQVRWTGFRSGVRDEESEPDVKEVDKYEGLMQDVKSPLTLMFFHGGGF